MNKKQIHIVCFDVPLPADYGGVIDVVQRLKLLKKENYFIHLHFFHYGRSIQQDFSSICDKIYAYKRKKNPFYLFSILPFIVKSRENNVLLKVLLNTEGVIILEGQHGTRYLNELTKAGKDIYIRTHNVEWLYYKELAARSKGLKRWFFQLESKKLKRHESILNMKKLMTLSHSDTEYFSQFSEQVYFCPTPFDLPFRNTNPFEIDSNIILYHGNLSVPENAQAAQILLNKLPFIGDKKLVIAGKDPSEKLAKEIEKKGVQLIANPTEFELNKLLETCFCHILITDQTTGLKMKLLYALASGRPCIVNKKMVFGTDLEKFCTVWNEIEPLENCYNRLKKLNYAEINELKTLFSGKSVLEVINHSTSKRP